MHIQDIELALRGYLDALYPVGSERDTLLAAAKAQHVHVEPDRLTFGSLMKLVELGWAKFAPYFENLQMFKGLMEHVRHIRNELAHFTAETGPVGMQALNHALDWLENRESVSDIVHAKTVTVTNTLSIPASASLSLEYTVDGGRSSKYGPLKAWLMQQQDGPMNVTFEDVERIIGSQLPPSARRLRNWWANDSVGHVQSKVWLNAGWKVIDVDVRKQQVTFRQKLPGEQV